MRRAQKDLIWIVVGVAPVLFAASHYDAFEWLVQWSRQHEALELDEWITLSLFLWLAFGLFAARRWKDARNELKQRIQTEQALRVAHDDLDRKVKQRTKDLVRLNDQLEKEIDERKSVEVQIRRLLYDNRRLNQQALSLLEEQRRELARELHDEFGQCLTAIQIDVRIANEMLSSDAERACESLQSVLSVTQRMYDAMGALARRLRPETLEDLGLIGAIEDEVAAWRVRTPFCGYQLQMETGELNLPDALAIQVYRVFQECLNNIHKHANASKIWIALTEEHGPGVDELRLSVRDDGVGVNADEPHSGLGLVGMRERAEMLGGSFEIISQIGQGTEIQFRLPMHDFPAMETHR